MTDHIDYEDAVFFRCSFSSSDKVPKGNKGQQVLRGFSSSSPSLFSGLTQVTSSQAL